MDLNALSDEKLDQAFKKAYDAVSQTKYKFKQDTLLYFYAYYKNTSKEFNIDINQTANNGEKLVNAFKMNALFQVRHLDERQSKIKYIELAVKYIGEDFLKPF
jgi:acyl-CoA-binding protein